MEKGFEGVWLGSGFENTTDLTGGIESITKYDLKSQTLIIKKIALNQYLIKKINNITKKSFTLVAIKTTNDEKIIQSGANGFDSYYFEDNDCEILSHNYTEPISSNNTIVSSIIQFHRI